MTEPWPLLKGLLTRVPGLYRTRVAAHGGSISARYCYSVWLRHLVALRSVGLQRLPAAVAELGPGLSLGVGLAALLSGSERYTALDVSRDAAADRHVPLVDDLAALFSAQSSIPNDAEFPEVLPRLASYGFPHALPGLTLPDPARVSRVRALLAGLAEGRAASEGLALSYLVPWSGPQVPVEQSDLVIAQAVLEHAQDPDEVYAGVAQRLCAGGFLSLTIDFRSHGLTREWNAHWTYSERAWHLVQGARPWGLNRWPLARHLEAISRAGLRVLSVERVKCTSHLSRSGLADAFRDMAPDDLETSGAYVAAVRC